MKNPKLTLLSLVALSLPATAQGPPQGPPPDPIATALDRDGDGELSRSEIRAAVRALRKLDEDRDGRLSAEELRPEPPRGQGQGRKGDGQGQGQGKGQGKGQGQGQGRPPMPPPSKIFTALDTDKSGDLSVAELEAAAESLKDLDFDDNGKLTGDESGIEKPQGGQGGGQGRGPGGPGGGRGRGPGGPPRR